MLEDTGTELDLPNNFALWFSGYAVEHVLFFHYFSSGWNWGLDEVAVAIVLWQMSIHCEDQKCWKWIVIVIIVLGMFTSVLTIDNIVLCKEEPYKSTAVPQSPDAFGLDQ